MMPRHRLPSFPPRLTVRVDTLLPSFQAADHTGWHAIWIGLPHLEPPNALVVRVTFRTAFARVRDIRNPVS